MSGPCVAGLRSLLFSTVSSWPGGLPRPLLSGAPTNKWQFTQKQHAAGLQPWPRAFAFLGFHVHRDVTLPLSYQWMELVCSSTSDSRPPCNSLQPIECPTGDAVPLLSPAQELRRSRTWLFCLGALPGSSATKTRVASLLEDEQPHAAEVGRLGRGRPKPAGPWFTQQLSTHA